MEQILPYLVIVALGIPLAAYVWAATRTPRSKVSTAAGYFVAFRQVGTAPFANSSLAYAFQVATLFPFLYWGVQGQILPALVNAVCWGIGIFLFRRCLPGIVQCLGTDGVPRTLHGLLGLAYLSKAVQRVASWVTIIGMMGIALAEAYWGMQIVKVLVREDTPAYCALVFGTLLFVLAYIWYGGAWGSMRTDMLQLAFSYIGFTIVFVFAILSILSSGIQSRPETAIVSIFMVVAGGLSFAIRRRNKIKPVSGMDPSDSSDENQPSSEEGDGAWQKLSKWLSRLTLMAILLLALSFAVLFFRSLPAGSLSPLINPGDPKWVGVLALAVMSLTFQFVDMSAWQRLQAIGGSTENVKNSARRGLLLFGIESPFSWLMCLSLGTLLITTMPQLATVDDKAGPLAAYPRLLIESGLPLQVLVATLFMTAVMGVMMSTIDSALVAAMYAYVADVRGCAFRTEGHAATEEDKSQDRKDLLSGKKTAFWLIICVSAGILLLGWVLKSPDKLIGIMVGFYGSMLSLLPAVLVMVTKQAGKFSGKAVALGMAAGVIGAVGFTFWGLFNPDRSWDAVFIAPVLAAAFPLAARVLGRKGLQP